MITYRKALKSDLPAICKFVDYWLSGRAKKHWLTLAGNDYFISPRQHTKYLNHYTIILALSDDLLVGWAVKQHQQTLIHLLVAADYRGQGIGQQLIKHLNPRIVRCKTDQQTGDPTSFFKKLGYKPLSNIKIGRQRNISLLTNL